MQSITCPNCRRVGTVPQAVAVGTKIRCPGCSTMFRVRAEDAHTVDVATMGVEAEESGYAVAAPVARRAPVAPMADADLDGAGADPSKLSPAMASAHLSPPIPDKPPATPSPDAPAEPWYYGWLERVAGLLWYGAMVLVVLNGVAVAGVAVFSINAFGRIVQGAWFVMAGLFAAPLVTLLPVAVASALLRLAVDHSRNTRAIRFDPR